MTRTTMASLAFAIFAFLDVTACLTDKPPLSPSAAVRSAQPATQLLNSERIAQKFGNYDIEVLPDSNSNVRLSNLFSRHDGKKICRTFAATFFAENIHPALAAEHALIVEKGQSIGAVFKNNGWEVKKRPMFIGSLEKPGRRILQLMNSTQEISLAMYIYVFSVVKGALEMPYATIAEVYHARYLGEDDLWQMHGDDRSSLSMADEVARIIARVKLAGRLPDAAS